MLLDENLKKSLTTYFERLEHPVYIALVNSKIDIEKATRLNNFINEIVACSPLLSAIEFEDPLIEDYPAIGVSSSPSEFRALFAGLPMGHELTSFVLTILWAGGAAPKYSDSELEMADNVSTPKVITSYVSLSCHNCPEIVQSLMLLAIRNSRIKHIMVEGGFNKDIVESLNILAVPEVFVDNEKVHAGKATFNELFSNIFKDEKKRISKELNSKITTNHVFDVAIVGAGPAGMTSAIYLARKGKSVVVVGSRVGGQLNETLDIENFIGTSKTTGSKLSLDLKNHSEDYPNILIEEGFLISNLVKLNSSLFSLTLDSDDTLLAKRVIIATGATWKKLGVKGEEEFRGKGVAYCPHCDGPFFKGKDVVVSGGGNSGVEAAIDLAGIVNTVTIIQRNSELKADSVLVSKLKSIPNISVLTNTEITEISGTGSVSEIIVINNVSNETSIIKTSAVFVQIGLLPNTSWIPTGLLDITSFKEIEVDANHETSCAGIFAAGDVTSSKYKQIVSAIGDGANTALSVFESL